jgi:hypothetical protein
MVHTLFRKNAFIAASLIAIPAALAACGDDETGTTSTTTTSSSTTSTSSSTTSSGSGGSGGEGGAGGGSACADPNPAVPANTIRGEISYNGQKFPATDPESTVYVAALKSFPPQEMPAGFHIEMPPMGGSVKFPFQYEITNVKPGDYYVFAFIDLKPNNPSMPDMADPKGIVPMPPMPGGPEPAPETKANVTDCEGEAVNVEIFDDPPPMMPMP